MMGREGNLLSPVIRQAWDAHDLQIITKNSPARSTSPHISIVGHITIAELRRYLTATDGVNGFANRFLWVVSRRSRRLPHGGAAVDITAETRVLSAAVDAARRRSSLTRDAAANRLWEVSDGRPGLFGSVTARAEAQTMRLAALYALADGTATIGVAHLRAGLELWRYCFESARFLFGDQTGDVVADTILAALKRCAPESMTRTESSGLFKRNRPATEIARGLKVLEDAGRITADHDRSRDGRPVERWFYADQRNEVNPEDDINPFVSTTTTELYDETGF